MGFKGKETQIEVLFFQHVLVTDKINEESQYGIGTAANGIAECLLTKSKNFAERWIEEINEG